MLPKAKQAHVDAWRMSGLSQSAYSRQQGLNNKTFNRWCQQAQSNAKPAAKLLPVSIKPSTLTQPYAPIRLQLRADTVLELPVDISARWLSELLRCLD